MGRAREEFGQQSSAGGMNGTREDVVASESFGLFGIPGVRAQKSGGGQRVWPSLDRAAPASVLYKIATVQ